MKDILLARNDRHELALLYFEGLGLRIEKYHGEGGCGGACPAEAFPSSEGVVFLISIGVRQWQCCRAWAHLCSSLVAIDSLTSSKILNAKAQWVFGIQSSHMLSHMLVKPTPLLVEPQPQGVALVEGARGIDVR